MLLPLETNFKTKLQKAGMMATNELITAQYLRDLMANKAEEPLTESDTTGDELKVIIVRPLDGAVPCGRLRSSSEFVFSAEPKHAQILKLSQGRIWASEDLSLADCVLCWAGLGGK